MKGYFCSLTVLFLFLFGVLSFHLYASNAAQKARPPTKENLKDHSLFAVQLNSSTKKSIIKKLQKKLTENGFPSYIIEKVLNKTKWYRLRIGFFTTKTEANNKAKEVSKSIPEFKTFFIVLPAPEEIKLQQ